MERPEGHASPEDKEQFELDLLVVQAALERLMKAALGGSVQASQAMLKIALQMKALAETVKPGFKLQ